MPQRRQTQTEAMIRIGTAGWAIPAPYRSGFPESGSLLEKYAARLTGAEINSSFHRPHQRKTYERWAASVPAGFRFAAKVPRTITHEHRLSGYGEKLAVFLDEVGGLGAKLDVFLVQLAPSLIFDKAVAGRFFRDLARADARIACEPRHASWFTPEADKALQRLGVARVAADPPRAPAGGQPGGDTSFAYWRLHGSPRVYYSDYEESMLTRLAKQLRQEDWCMFDNTMGGHALGNALRVQALTKDATGQDELSRGASPGS